MFAPLVAHTTSRAPARPPRTAHTHRTPPHEAGGKNETEELRGTGRVGMPPSSEILLFFRGREGGEEECKRVDLRISVLCHMRVVASGFWAPVRAVRASDFANTSSSFRFRPQFHPVFHLRPVRHDCASFPHKFPRRFLPCSNKFRPVPENVAVQEKTENAHGKHNRAQISEFVDHPRSCLSTPPTTTTHTDPDNHDKPVVLLILQQQKQQQQAF